MSPSAKAMMWVTWSWPGTIALLFLILFPIYAPLLPVIEGQLLPVTGKIEFVDEGLSADGKSTTLRMKFEKLRDCEYLGVTADQSNGPLDFAPVSGSTPITVATGERISQLWRIGTSHLDGVRIRWAHRCNPYWITVTVGYP